MAKSKAPALPTLPAGMQQTDLELPSRGGYTASFTMYHVTGWGWVIPTLHIRNASSRQAYRNPTTAANARTYAVRVDNGGVCRVGLGPHVTHNVTVYVRPSRAKALQRFLDLQEQGAVKANQIRDRISTRRAMTAERRMGLWY